MSGDAGARFDPGVEPEEGRGPAPGVLARPIPRQAETSAGSRPERAVGSRDGERVHHPAGGPEPVGRVLGVQPRLDRVPHGRRGAGRERPALGDRELQRHQVDVVHALSDRVLDLEPGVELKKIELALLVASVPGDQELHRARVDVADRPRQRRGGAEQALAKLRTDGRRRRLLDHLGVATLDGAVALSQRPYSAGLVGDHLHLDVAGAGQQRLAENRAVAERGLRLAPCRLNRLAKLTRGVHGAHPAAAAAG